MTKSDKAYLKSIAKRLPVVNYRFISGFEQLEEGNIPHEDQHKWNHYRRLRRAFERSGVEGIKQYITQINGLQNSQREGIHTPAE
jgi:hypothetical protein